MAQRKVVGQIDDILSIHSINMNDWYDPDIVTEYVDPVAKAQTYLMILVVFCVTGYAILKIFGGI